GSAFTGTVSEDVVVDGVTVIPAGAEVSGHLLDSARSGKASGRPHMQLGYDAVSFGGQSYNIAAVSDTMVGKGGSGKDAAMIGGGAVAGGVLGKVLGGSAVGGAVAGAAAGTAASLLTRGPDLHLEPGKKLTVTLQSPVTVTKTKAGAETTELSDSQERRARGSESRGLFSWARCLPEYVPVPAVYHEGQPGSGGETA